MDRKKAVLGGVLVAIGIVVVVLFTEVKSQRERNAGLLARVAQLESVRLPAAPVENVATMPGSAPQAGATDGEPAPATATVAATPPAEQADPLGAVVRQLTDSEEGREYTRSMSVLALREQYPDLAQALALTEEQVQQLIDVLARHRVETGLDRVTLINTPRDRAAGEQLARSIAEKEQAQEGELAALLGDKYMQWKDYQRTAATRQREDLQRRQVEQLRTAVSAPGRPVGEAQFSALRAALEAEQQRIQVESRGLGMQQQAARVSEDHQRLLDVAALHLDPVQLESYRRHLRQQADLMRMMAGVMGTVSGSAAPSPAPAANPAAD